MVLTSEQIRVVELKAVEHGMSWLRLMENAGSSAVREIRKHFALENKKVVIVCGKGNNGGDGYVVARKLLEDNANIRVISADYASTESCKEMLTKAQNHGIRPIDFDSYTKLSCQYLLDADIIIDSLFGIGFNGDVSGKYSTIIDTINQSKAFKISIDVPSGMCSDKSFLSNHFVKADFTVTFIAYKPCHLLYPSNSYCGKVVVGDIGISDEITKEINPLINVVSNKFVINKLPIRDINFHKGLCGTAGLFVGCKGMAGAAVIATKAAITSGVGIANVIIPESIYNIVGTSLPEAICTIYSENIDDSINLANTKNIVDTISKCTSGLIGCGLGQSEHSKYTVCEILKHCDIPIVIDADGINVLEESIDLIKNYKNAVILTPHPKEAARLLKTTVDEVLNNRLGAVKELVKITNAVCVLKGANSLISLPNGKTYVVTDGNPGMATAGSGDMLAGMITAFIAQGLTADDATLLSVKLHAMSGDSALNTSSILSMTPTDMLKELPNLFNSLYQKK